MSVRAMGRGVRAAIVFLTRVPVGGFPYTKEEWRWSSAHFPLVGALLGAGLGGIDRLLAPAGELPAAILTLAVGLLATGAFHEDGLADTADALGGAMSRDKILLILKDSRVGAFGASALVVTLAARAALIARLGPAAWWALPLTMCAARVGPVWQMVAMPYATAVEGSKSRDVTRAGPRQAVLASLWALSLAALLVSQGHLSGARTAAALAAAGLVAIVTGWRYVRRLGGITGDFLGATEQIGEIAILLVLAWGRA